MKTPDEIAGECCEKWFGAEVFKGSRLRELVTSAINEAVTQERERVCEWVDDGGGAFWGYRTACEQHYGRGFAFGFTFCPNCGGKIKVKEESE